MSDRDPEKRGGTRMPDAQQRWEEEGNPPSQPAPRGLAAIGWMLYAAIGLVVVIVIALLLIFHGG
ncbi:MAG TPA: hypothetical protein VIA06_15325 [Candidatus Dormibacteraeota bacterium]|jgi:hypothetical protein|nr:hypothetical protein [Candidatus Dormibacteraeota bacterium]